MANLRIRARKAQLQENIQKMKSQDMNPPQG